MKSLTLFFTFVLVSYAVNAQRVDLGIGASSIFGRIAGDGMSSRYSPGFEAGITGNIRLAPRWSIGSEIQLAQVSVLTGELTHFYVTTARPAANNKYIYMRYLAVPVLGSYQLAKNFSIQGGVQGSYLLRTDEHIRRDDGKSFKDLDLSLVGGLRITVSKRAGLTARYVSGISNINDNIISSRKWFSQQIQFGIHYRVF